MNRNWKELSFTAIKKKKGPQQIYSCCLQTSLSWRLEYDRELIFKFLLYFIIINATLSKSLLFTASFLIVWNRVYAGCNPYAHRICINNGKKTRKKWRKTWQIYRFGSAHLQLLSSFAIRPMETKPLLALTKKNCRRSFSQCHEISHFRIIIRWLVMITDSKISESCVYSVLD